MLDRIARRYHTDPWSVLEWAPDRVAMAIACMDQAMATMEQQGKAAKGAVFPVMVVGSL